MTAASLQSMRGRGQPPVLQLSPHLFGPTYSDPRDMVAAIRDQMAAAPLVPMRGRGRARGRGRGRGLPSVQPQPPVLQPHPPVQSQHPAPILHFQSDPPVPPQPPILPVPPQPPMSPDPPQPPMPPMP